MKYSQVLFSGLFVSIVLLIFGLKSSNWTLLWLALIGGFVALIGYFLSFINKRIKKMKPGITVLSFLFFCLILNACMLKPKGDAYVTYKNESELGTLNRIFSYTTDNGKIVRRELKNKRTYPFSLNGAETRKLFFETQLIKYHIVVYNTDYDRTKPIIYFDSYHKFDSAFEFSKNDSAVIIATKLKQ